MAYSYDSLMPPMVKAEKAMNQANLSSMRSTIDLAKVRSQLSNLDSMLGDNDSLFEQAQGIANERFPGIWDTFDEAEQDDKLFAIGTEYYDSTKKEADGLRQALKEAIAAGAATRPEDVIAKDGTLPSKDAPGMVSNALAYLESGSRPISGAHGSGLTKALEITEGVSMGTVQRDPGAEETLQGQIDRYAWNPHAPPKPEFEKQFTGKDRPFTIEGVPVAALVEKIWDEPKNFFDIAAAMKKGASETFLETDPKTEFDYDTALEAAQKRYEEAAWDQAVNEWQNGFIEEDEVETKAEEYYEGQVSEDALSWNVANPGMARFAHEMLLDVYNVAGPLKLLKYGGAGAKGAAKGLIKGSGYIPKVGHAIESGAQGMYDIAAAAGITAKAKVGKKAKEAGLWATKWARSDSHLDPMQFDEAGREFIGDIAVGRAKAGRVTTIVRNMREKYMHPIRKIKNPAEKELLYKFATGQEVGGKILELADLPANLQKAAKAHLWLRKFHTVARRISGLGNEFVGGVLEGGQELAHYAPAQLRKEKTILDDIAKTSEEQIARDTADGTVYGVEGAGYGPGGGRGTIEARSAKKRKAELEQAVPDLAAQWDHEMDRFVNEIAPAMEIKAIDKALEANNMILKFDSPSSAKKQVRLGEKGVAKLAKRKARLEKTKNAKSTKWRTIDGKLKDLERRIAEAKTAHLPRAKTETERKRIALARKKDLAKKELQRADLVKQRDRAGKEYKVATKAHIRAAGTVARFSQKALNSDSLRFARSQEARTMAEQSGVEWSFLNATTKDGAPKLAETYERLTGKPWATALGESIYIVPKPVVKHLEMMMPALGMAKTEMSEALKGIKYVYERTGKPLNQWFRTSVTLPRLMYYGRNMVGGFGLSYIAHGMRALDPRLQLGAARAAGVAAGWGSKSALAAKFPSRTGVEMTWESIVKEATKLDLMDQTSFVLGSEKGYGKGILGKAVEVQRNVARLDISKIPGVDIENMPFGPKIAKGLRMISPETAARASDNYQKLVVFAGALDDLSPEAVKRAFEFTNEFAGNYSKMSAIEKSFIREVVPFYSWLRFITPHIMKQMVTNPARLATFEKMRAQAEREWGGMVPTIAMGVRGFQQHFGATAPPHAQPDALQRYLETGESPEMGTNEFSMMVIETPILMGLGPLKALAHTFDRDPTTMAPESVISMLGPLAVAFGQMLTGTDWKTGHPIEDFISFESGQAFGASHTGRFLKEMSGSRGLTPFMDLIKLYSSDRPMEALDLGLRYAAYNNFMGIDHLIAPLFGVEPRSLGVAPLISAYTSKPVPDAMKKTSKLVKGITGRSISLQHGQLPFGIMQPEETEE